MSRRYGYVRFSKRRRAPFGTDAAKFRLQGAKAYGFLPVVVTPEIVGSMHSDNERIALDGFNRGIHIFYEIIRTFLNNELAQEEQQLLQGVGTASGCNGHDR